MENSDQLSDLPSSLTPKVEFSISPRAPVPGHPAASGSAHPPRPDPVPSHPAAPMRPAPFVTDRLHFRHDLLQKLKTSCFTS